MVARDSRRRIPGKVSASTLSALSRKRTVKLLRVGSDPSRRRTLPSPKVLVCLASGSGVSFAFILILLFMSRGLTKSRSQVRLILSTIDLVGGVIDAIHTIPWPSQSLTALSTEKRMQVGPEERTMSSPPKTHIVKRTSLRSLTEDMETSRSRRYLVCSLLHITDLEYIAKSGSRSNRYRSGDPREASRARSKADGASYSIGE